MIFIQSESLTGLQYAIDKRIRLTVVQLPRIDDFSVVLAEVDKESFCSKSALCTVMVIIIPAVGC